MTEQPVLVSLCQSLPSVRHREWGPSFGAPGAACEGQPWRALGGGAGACAPAFYLVLS